MFLARWSMGYSPPYWRLQTHRFSVPLNWRGRRERDFQASSATSSHGQNPSISEHSLAFVRTPMRELTFSTLSKKWEVVWEKVRERKRRCFSGFLSHSKFFGKFVKSSCYVPSFKWHSTSVYSGKR